MLKEPNKIMNIVKKAILLPCFVVAIVLFSTESDAQDSVDIKYYYEDDNLAALVNLKIHSLSEDDHVALIELFLKVDSPVLFQLTNEEETFTIVDKDLPAGSHHIHFDYSNLTDADFSFTFKEGEDRNIELNGPFIKDGKLQTIPDTLMPPPPSEPIAPSVDMSPKEKATFDKASTTYQNLYIEYMSLDPDSATFQEMETAYKKVHEAAENVQKVFKEIAGEDVVPPPIKLGPNPEKRKYFSSDEVQKSKALMDEVHETWQQKWGIYWEIEPAESNLETLKAAYKTALKAHEKLGEAQTGYYNSIGKQAPPMPPMPPKPETRIENGKLTP